MPPSATIMSGNEGVQAPLLNQLPDQPAIFDDVLIDYFSYSSVAHKHRAIFVCNVEQCAADLADLSDILEPQLCDQQAFDDPKKFLFRLWESSRASINQLKRITARDRRFAALNHSINQLVGAMLSDSLRRYLQPGSFITAATLDRDLHPSLLQSPFELFYSDTFSAKRPLVEDYINRLNDAHRGDVTRGYADLLTLAGLHQLDRFDKTSDIIRAALRQLRHRTVRDVLLSILKPRDDFQLQRLGQLIAFSFSQPALSPEPRSPGFVRSLLRSLLPPYGNAASCSVATQIVLRLRSCVLVVDEYPDGRPSVNLTRLICMFQRDRTESVSLADYGVFVAPYCSDVDTQLRYFGSDEKVLSLLADEQLNHNSVRAVVFFIGRIMAARLSQPDSVERRMLLAGFKRESCELLLVLDDGANLPDEIYDLVDSRRTNLFCLGAQDEHQIVWRNFLVRLSSLPPPPPEL